LIAGYTSGVTYPSTPIGRSLALAAQIVGSKLGTRVLFVQLGSFDTHTTQKGTQDRLLADFASGISAFYADLAAHGNADRVLTMTFSEFGRRVAENANGGTDHGAAAPIFVVGNKVSAGLLGRYPSLAPEDLYQGDIRYNVDFRSVYAGVLEDWLKTRSAPILGRQFAPLKVV